MKCRGKGSVSWQWDWDEHDGLTTFDVALDVKVDCGAEDISAKGIVYIV